MKGWKVYIIFGQWQFGECEWFGNQKEKFVYVVMFFGGVVIVQIVDDEFIFVGQLVCVCIDDVEVSGKVFIDYVEEGWFGVDG